METLTVKTRATEAGATFIGGKGGKTGRGQRGNSLIIRACGQCKDSEKWRLMGEHGAED